MNADGTTHLVMFDIDGTLLRSSQFDAELFELAVKEVLAISVDTDWSRYQHVSDTGILLEIIEEYQLQDRRDEIQHQVKACFIERVAAYLSQHGVAEIPGASAFLKVLCERDEFSVAIATGGWRETALMKLDAAGVVVEGLPLASADDHFDRTEIMRVSERKSGHTHFASRTYFGDGIWDKLASQALGYEFILVGNQIAHPAWIENFLDQESLVKRVLG